MNATQTTHDSLAHMLSLVRDDMAKVDQLILSKAEARVELIPIVTNHLISSGGKRLRPLLTLIAAHACGYEGDKHITMAASIEFMHTATLLHDDVVDDSTLRRGKKTARMLWGNPASVLVGDYLLGQAFKMMVTTRSIDALACLANAAAIIAEGEVMQLALSYTLDNQDSDYQKIIGAKTAALFIATAKVGAILSEAPDTIQQSMADFGYNLGIAFQLADDVLDYQPDNILGKKTGDDFYEGKTTLPIILAYKNGNQQQRTFLEKAFAQGADRSNSFTQAYEIVHETCAIDACQERAVQASNTAIAALSSLPDTPFREALSNLASFASARCLTK